MFVIIVICFIVLMMNAIVVKGVMKMDKQEIKKALSFEYAMYLIAFTIFVVIGIISLIEAWEYANIHRLMIGLLSLFIAYLGIKRGLYLIKLEESISIKNKEVKNGKEK